MFLCVWNCCCCHILRSRFVGKHLCRCSIAYIYAIYDRNVRSSHYVNFKWIIIRSWQQMNGTWTTKIMRIDTHTRADHQKIERIWIGTHWFDFVSMHVNIWVNIFDVFELISKIAIMYDARVCACTTRVKSRFCGAVAGDSSKINSRMFKCLCDQNMMNRSLIKSNESRTTSDVMFILGANMNITLMMCF